MTADNVDPRECYERAARKLEEEAKRARAAGRERIARAYLLSAHRLMRLVFTQGNKGGSTSHKT